MTAISQTLSVDEARECLYRFLAAALADPRDARWQALGDPANAPLVEQAAALLAAEAAAQPVPLGFGELAAERLAVAPLLRELHDPAVDLEAEHDRVFGLVCTRECPPYETEYLTNEESFFRSQQMADVAGFYRAFGLAPARGVPDRPDHLALELEFLAFLLLKRRLAGPEQSSVCDAAFASFFRDHIAWWVPSFTVGLRRKAEHGFYAALSDLLAAFLPTERARLHLPPPRLPLTAAEPERTADEEATACASCALAP